MPKAAQDDSVYNFAIAVVVESHETNAPDLSPMNIFKACSLRLKESDSLKEVHRFLFASRVWDEQEKKKMLSLLRGCYLHVPLFTNISAWRIRVKIKKYVNKGFLFYRLTEHPALTLGRPSCASATNHSCGSM